MNHRFAALAPFLLAVAHSPNVRAQAPQPPLQPLPQQPAPPAAPQPSYPQQPPQAYPQQPPTQPYPAQPQQAPPQAYPQQPYPQQPAPQQPYPQQPYPQQPYPQQPPQAYPQQLPPPGYPQQQQLPPPGYPQQPQMPPPGYPQAMPPQGPPPQPLAPPVPSDTRDPNEMAVLYGTSIAYGLGTGIWIDGLAHQSDPGIAFIAPLAFGAAVPIGVYLWDDNYVVHRGVPSSMSAGLVLGAVEGISIAGVQWQHNGRGGPGTWSFATQTSVTWLLATGGGVGGYAFGEWLHPDPRSLGFIADGAGWGAISGALMGAGVGSGDWKNGASIGGILGYNAGILIPGALSVSGYVPSWRTQQAMWLGYLVGTAATSVVYLFYIGSNDDPRHGMIANSLGGLAGVGVAALLTANMKDPDQTSRSFLPPFQVGITPTQHGGMQLSAFGMF